MTKASNKLFENSGLIMQGWLMLLISTLVWVIFLCAPAPVFAQQVTEQIANMMTAGWRSQTTHELVPTGPGSVRAIPNVIPSAAMKSVAWQKFRKYADMRFDLSATRVVMVARNGKMVYERSQADKVNPDSTPIGNSISKSLVSLAVGKALCAKAIPDLDIRLAEIVPELQGLSWGEASLRDNLRMSSGAFVSEQVYPTGFRNEQDMHLNRAIYSRRLTQSFVDLMKRVDQKSLSPGTKFEYNNYDNISLALTVEAATKQPFSRYFTDQIWSQIGAEGDGAWITNEKGEVASYFGFSARPKDWLRLGIWVLEQRNKQDCFGTYLKQATQEQIVANWPINKSYGYQIWTNCTKIPGSFCFLGVHGQQLIFDPASQTVLYVHATSNATNKVWRDVFERLP